MKVVMIGSGNLATRLACALHALDRVEITQVYSRTESHAAQLAERLSCPYTCSVQEIRTNADLYLFSLKDKALEETLAQVPTNQGLWLHTAGSMPMTVFANHTQRYGVLYPLQTFSKQREVNFRTIPLFLECHRPEDATLLEQLACRLSDRVQFLSSEDRRLLHLAAVFACNFTNHMYARASQILTRAGISEEVLLPLIDETAAKVHEMPAMQAQTGPAIRYDENVIRKHLTMLDDMPDLQQIYQLLSQDIHKTHQASL